MIFNFIRITRTILLNVIISFPLLLNKRLNRIKIFSRAFIYWNGIKQCQLWKSFNNLWPLFFDGGILTMSTPFGLFEQRPNVLLRPEFFIEKALLFTESNFSKNCFAKKEIGIRYYCHRLLNYHFTYKVSQKKLPYSALIYIIIIVLHGKE